MSFQFLPITDDSKCKDVLALRVPSLACALLKILFFNQVGALNDVRQSDENEEIQANEVCVPMLVASNCVCSTLSIESTCSGLGSCTWLRRDRHEGNSDCSHVAKIPCMYCKLLSNWA